MEEQIEEFQKMAQALERKLQEAERQQAVAERFGLDHYAGHELIASASYRLEFFRPAPLAAPHYF